MIVQNVAKIIGVTGRLLHPQKNISIVKLVEGIEQILITEEKNLLREAIPKTNG